MKWVIIIAIVIILLCVMYVIATANSFVKLKTMVEEAFSTMDVYLKKRWDLVPNLVNTVKGYAKHESEVLSSIAELRGKSYSDMSSDEKIDTNNKLSRGINKLLAIAENYPELKANEGFKQLTAELSSIEDDIANSRKYYNGTVKKYNIKVQSIPSNIIANIFGYKKEKMFEIQEEERQNVEVKF